MGYHIPNKIYKFPICNYTFMLPLTTMTFQTKTKKVRQRTSFGEMFDPKIDLGRINTQTNTSGCGTLFPKYFFIIK